MEKSNENERFFYKNGYLKQSINCKNLIAWIEKLRAFLYNIVEHLGVIQDSLISLEIRIIRILVNLSKL